MNIMNDWQGKQIVAYLVDSQCSLRSIEVRAIGDSHFIASFDKVFGCLRYVAEIAYPHRTVFAFQREVYIRIIWMWRVSFKLLEITK